LHFAPHGFSNICWVSLNQQVENRARLGLGTFRLTFAFTILYALVWLYFVLWLKTLDPGSFYQLAFSPFSPTEDDLLHNFVYVLGALALLEAYVRLRAPRFVVSGRFLDIAFLLGIVVSYFHSTLTFYYRSFPSAGTSIIGTCVGLVGFGIAGYDFLGVTNRFRLWRKGDPPLPYGALAGTMAVAVIFLLFLMGYGGAKLTIHFAAALIFVPLIGLVTAVRLWRNDRGEVYSTVAFICIVVFVVGLFVFPTLAATFKLSTY
jgi:hypothetical protein